MSTDSQREAGWRSFLGYVATFLLGIGFYTGLYFVLDVLSRWWGAGFGVSVYAVVMLFEIGWGLLLILFRFITRTDSGVEIEQAHREAFTQILTGRVGLQSVLVMLVFYVVAFGQLCRQVNLLGGGFSAAPNDYWTWVGFAFSQVANYCPGNAWQVFGGPISSITPTTIVARLLIVLSNLVLGGLILGQFFAVGRDTLKSYWEFPRRPTSR